MTKPDLLPDAAYENLRQHQQQLDMDGCMVGVSRQALDEILSYVDSTRTPNKPSEVDLVSAAQAVIERWDGPKWKFVEPTAAVINRLRAALSGHLATGKGDTDVIAAYSAAFPMSANEEHAKWFAEYVAGIRVTGKGGGDE